MGSHPKRFERKHTPELGVCFRSAVYSLFSEYKSGWFKFIDVGGIVDEVYIIQELRLLLANFSSYDALLPGINSSLGAVIKM
jgi:hypothetical protein